MERGDNMPILNHNIRQQIQSELKSTILNNKNNNQFVVCDCEAGSGKTHVFIEAVKELYMTQSNKKVLFVQSFKDENLKPSIEDRINIRVGKKIAKSINSNTPIEERTIKNISQYNVIIITHQMYLSMMTDDKKKKLYTDAREILVIDEALNWMQRLEIDMVKIERLHRVLPRTLMLMFLQIIKEIESFIYKETTDKQMRYTRVFHDIF